jgi:citrate lyase subunit beta/citryl-CoA lyase
MRPMHLRRSWLFVGAADNEAIRASNESSADACIQEFEDFCVPEMREQARIMMPDILSDWRARNKVATVRINPLEDPDGFKDLQAAMKAGVDAILIPKANTASQMITLEKHVNDLEKSFNRVAGSTPLIPNIEQATGLENAVSILSASKQIVGSLVASEDMAVSLNAPRKKDSEVLNYVRQRFHIACAAVGVTSIDMPYTFTDDDGVRQQTELARDTGMVSKSTVNADHCQIINAILTPSDSEIEYATELVSAFETARKSGDGQVIFAGTKVEVPTYLNAKQAITRYYDLRKYDT